MSSLMELPATMIHRCCQEYYTLRFRINHSASFEILFFNGFQKFLTSHSLIQFYPEGKKFTVLIFEKIQIRLTFFEDII